MTSGKPVVDLADVTLVRSGSVILRDVSWRIMPGEHWALLGANGSGKTSLLSIVSGFLWPSEGSASVLGERFGQTDLRELRKRIGWVSPALQEWIPVRDTGLDTALTGLRGTLGVRAEHSGEERDCARGLLNFLGCGAQADQPFRTLSQGERQKVLIARAMVSGPQLLIFDEICSGLDLAAREGFLETVERLAHEPGGPTLILVTHHIEEIVPAFSHAMVLRAGEVVAQGPRDDVLTSDVFSAAYDLPVTVETIGERQWAFVRTGRIGGIGQGPVGP